MSVIGVAEARLGTAPVGGRHPVAVMGVLNVSPESFYAGSVLRDEAALLRTAAAMVEAGATVLDVGARSSAPYLDTAIDEAEETRRLGRSIEALAARCPVPISADTARVGPARAALEAGATIINDVTALRSPALAALVAASGASVVLMASSPPDRAAVAGTGDRRVPIVVVRDLLQEARARARAAGIPDDRIVLDPGLGFFRNEGGPWHAWDASVLAQLDALRALGHPLCVGVSRKSFLGALTGRAVPADRLAASLAATALVVWQGAALVRTHDVAATVDAVRVAERLAAVRWGGPA